MNTPKNTRVPAFPSPPFALPNGMVKPGFEGMTLRDWFAGQALAGILADSKSEGTITEYARDAYRYADAMLTAREGGSK